jgi:hypothetical protein
MDKSLRTFALAAVAARTVGHTPADASAEIGYLRAQLATVAPGGAWADGLQAYLERPAAADEPLLDLTRLLDLSQAEALAVALAAAVEDDLMAGRAVAFVQAPIGGSRPTLGLLGAALSEIIPGGAAPVAALVQGSAVRSGLLSLLNESAPLPERPVAVPLPLCLALAGGDGEWAGVAVSGRDQLDLPLPPSAREEAGRHARGLAAAPGRALVVRARSASEGCALHSSRVPP